MDCFMIGDFNLNKPEEESEISSDFQDIWKQVKPADQGFTFDPTINFTDQPGAASRQRRYDRIYVRSLVECWNYDSIEMIGTEPFEFTNNTGDTVKLFPSDHFGLICKISYTTDSKNQKSAEKYDQKITSQTETNSTKDAQNIYSAKLEDYLQSNNVLESNEGMKKRARALEVLETSLKIEFFKEASTDLTC